MSEIYTASKPHSSSIGGILERRRKPRVVCALPALVRHAVADGSRTSESAQVINLSASGLYLELEHMVAPNAKLFMVMWFSPHAEQAQKYALAAHGTVVRVDTQPHGTCGIAVRFEHYRFV